MRQDGQLGARVRGCASWAVQFHPHGGQFDVVWLPARTMHPPWGVRVVSQTKLTKIPTRNMLPLFCVIREHQGQVRHLPRHGPAGDVILGKKAFMFFGRVFFLIALGSPHVLRARMGVHRTCGGGKRNRIGGRSRVILPLFFATKYPN